jgi:uncharacterized protein
VYRRPKVVLSVRPIVSRCGSVTEDVGAAYCPADETLALSSGFLVKQIGWPDRDAAVAIVVAHEWGHHIQKLVGLTFLRGALGYFTIQMELQSDCFAGAFLDYSGRQGWFKREGLNDVLSAVAELGDVRGTPWFDPGAHGTPAQRSGALFEGYRSGAEPCLAYTPLPSKR